MILQFLLLGIMLFAGLQKLAFMAGLLELPEGALFCTLAPISAAGCRIGSAGISALYLIPYDDLDHTAVAWDAADQNTDLTLVALKTWTKFEFEADTAFFNQEKQAVGSNLNFVHTISINFANNDNATRAALKALDSCCNLVAYVVDNQGATRLVGIRPVSLTSSRSNKLKTGAGSYNTGADPTSDQNVRTVALSCNSPFEAVYTTVLESTLALT